MSQFVLRAAPLPPNFKGTIQQLFEAMIDRLEVVTNANIFQELDELPSSNEGPVLLHGTQWWVWDETLVAYKPLDISESETLEVVISETEPASAPPNVWFKTLGTAFVGIYVYMGSTAGWVLLTKELVNNSVATAMIQNGAVTSEKLASGISLASFSGLLALNQLTIGTAWKVLRMNAGATAPEWQDAIIESPEVAIVGGAGGTQNTVYTTPNTLGVLPRYVSWVLVCKVTEGGWAVNEELDALLALDSSDHDACSTTIRSTTEVGLIARRTFQPPQRDGSNRFLVTPANWKLKAYYAR